MPEPVGGEAPQQHRHVLGLVLGEARGGLVEQEHLGVEGEGPGQLDEAGRAGGQRAHHEVGDVGDADPLEHLVGHRTGVELRLVPGPALLGGDQHVLPGREAAEGLQLLEGAGDAQAGPAVRALAGDVGALEHHVALGRLLEPGDHVEQRGLAGTVGADEPGDEARLDLDAGVRHRLEHAEAHDDVVGGEDHAHWPTSVFAAPTGVRPAAVALALGVQVAHGTRLGHERVLVELVGHVRAPGRAGTPCRA